MKVMLCVTLAGALAALLGGMAVADSCHTEGGQSACAPSAATCEVGSAPTQSVCSVCGEKVGAKPVLLQAEREHLYDCIFCALLDSEHQGDRAIAAHSAQTGGEVKLDRKDGTWEASPSSAVALSLPSPPNKCGGRHLVFASREEFDSYLGAHPALAKEKPKPIPLTHVGQLLEAGRPPIPDEAVCPVSKRSFEPDSKTPWTIRDGEVYYFCCAGCTTRLK